jgi:DNA-directed RNA polymerase sigma subunit (sigma70/sigma32)
MAKQTEVATKKKQGARGGRKSSKSAPEKADGIRTVEAEVLDSNQTEAVDIENAREAGVDYAEQVRQEARDWESRGWVNRGQGDEIVDADDEPKFEDIRPLLNPPRDSGSKASDRAIATADPISQYMAEVRRYPLLTREQEHALAVRYRETGDKRAAEALVTSNLRFVVKVAAEYSKFGAKAMSA